MVGFFQRNDVKRIDVLRDVMLIVDDNHVFPDEDEIWMGDGEFASVAQMQGKVTESAVHFLAKHLQV